MNTRSNSSTLAKWLPSRGSVWFTLIVAAGLLVYAQRAGAFPASQALSPSGSPNTLPYQGRLTDSNGTPLDGTYSMSFQLYNSASGGSALWSEEWDFADSVVVKDGLFNVLLGSLTPIPQSVITGNSSLWLGISVETDSEMTPRVQVGSVPFAFQASRAYGLSAADGDPQDAVFVDANGLVGIGTALAITGSGSALWLQNISSALNEAAVMHWGSDLGSSRFIIFLAGSGYTYNPAWTNDLNFHTASDLDINFITSDVTRMSIDGGGNVGIGTTNPTNSLHVKRADGNVIAQFETSLVGGNAWIEITSSGQSYLIGTRADEGGNFTIYDNTTLMTRFSLTPSGNLGIGITNPTQPLHMASGAHVTVGGVWTNASDRNLKENFASIDSLSLLEKVAELPLSTWNYKTEGSEISHIGPMAQDFYAAFGVGEDDKHIGTVDANGVALAAIQGLYQLAQEQQVQINQQQETLTQLTTDNAALQDQVADLDTRLTALEQAIQSGQPVRGATASWGMMILGLTVGVGVVWGPRLSKRLRFG